MPELPQSFRRPGQANRRELNQLADARRGSARERGYSAAWDKAAKGHRRRSPLCRYCEIQGLPLTPATHTDHLYPHRVYDGVFWLTELWVSCCKPCHDGYKQALEHQGRLALDQLARDLALPTLAQALAARG